MPAPHSPYRIAIVGGIGSGKSIVSRLFRIMDIPVYDCDSEAKLLMNKDIALRSALTLAVGNQAYGPNGKLNRAFLASYMFGNPDRTALVNSIVHPTVRAHFSVWTTKSKSSVVAVETAILFESGMDADVDAVVWVYASEELRLQRAMQRNGADEAAIRRRMSNQMSVGELSARATYRIDNDGTASLIAQVQQVIREINEKCMR